MSVNRSIFCKMLHVNGQHSLSIAQGHLCEARAFFTEMIKGLPAKVGS